MYICKAGFRTFINNNIMLSMYKYVRYKYYCCNISVLIAFILFSGSILTVRAYQTVSNILFGFMYISLVL